MKVTKFQDLEVWQEARKLSLSIYLVSSERAFLRDLPLRDQMRRAAVSVMANIAEGYGRNSRRDFARFLTMSMGSLSELHSHLYLAIDLKYITTDVFKSTESQIELVGRQIGGFIKYLRKN